MNELLVTPREWLARIFAPLEARGVSVESVMAGPVRCPIAPMVPFADHVYPTKSGKFEFIAELRNPRRQVPGYPLTLVTNFSKKWLLSQMLESEHPKVAFIRIGTDTAHEYSIADRELIVIRSPVGSLKVQALVDPRVGRDMVIMPVGTWIKRGGGANVLTEDIISNFGQMAAYGETRVTLEKIGAAGQLVTGKGCNQLQRRCVKTFQLSQIECDIAHIGVHTTQLVAQGLDFAQGAVRVQGNDF